MTDILDELRILAQDGGMLSPASCVLIAHAADELESVYRALLATQASLIEANSHRIALSERVLEMKRKALVAPVTFTAPPLWRLVWNVPPCH